MQELKQNVVDLSQYGRPRAVLGVQGGRILDECGELVAMRLGQAMAKTLKLAGDDLLELIDRVTGYEMRRLYGEAREFSRDKTAPVESAVKKHFFLQFKRECRRDKNRDRDEDVDLSQLSLVEPDDLEESLAANNIGHAIGNICGEELFGIAKRMGVLLDDPELEYGDNPIGPEVIGAAVMEALREHTDRIKLRLALVPLIAKYLPKQVREIYQDVNRQLVDKGVLPTIKVGVKRPTQAAPRAHPESHDEAGPIASTAPDKAEPANQPAQDLLLVLQRLLSLGGGSQPGPVLPAMPPLPEAGGSQARGGPAAGVGVGPMGAFPAGLPGATGPSMTLPGSVAMGDVPGALPAAGTHQGQTGILDTPASSTFVQRLTYLQRGQVEAVPELVVAPEHIALGNVNVLRELRGQATAQGMPHMDLMTLDIVAMVFDYVLDDRRIPDAMKALIGRLQIPVLKVAMLDRAFFSQKTHVVRRLLDALAEAAMGWDEQEGHESGLYRKVDELVQRILNLFDEQVDIFEVCLAELEQYLDEENLRMAESAGRSAQIIQQVERGEQAHLLARDTVRGHLLDKPVPQLIHDFLLHQWLEVMARALDLHGENGAEWRQAVSTMEDLIWSVEPKQALPERRRLVELLPGLLKRLDQGLRDTGLDGGQRDQFFTGLVKCHAEAVRASIQGAEPTPLPRLVEQDEPATVMPDAHTANFQEIQVPDTNFLPSDSLMREIAAIRETAHANHREEVEEITISDVHWLAGGDYRETDEHDGRVRALKRGAWIQIRQEDGTTSRAKLAWISPLKGVYLFTNRLGQRAMSINAEGLAAKFRDGSVQLIDDVPLMDRAVNNLLERLQHPDHQGSNSG